MTMTGEQYHAKWGYLTNACDAGQNYNAEACADWKSLTHTDRGSLKNERPYETPVSDDEKRLREEWWATKQAGPDLDIWKGLSKILGIPPRAIKKHMMGLYGQLTKKPDFGEEYGIKASDLERDVSEQFAARGLLDSSMMGAAMGKGQAALMMERASMEENAWMNRLGRADQMVGRADDFADFLNEQFLQDLELGKEAIAYLTKSREHTDEFNLGRYAVNPNINDPITTTEGILMAIKGATDIGSMFIPSPGGGGDGFDPQSDFNDQQFRDEYLGPIE